MHAIEKDLTKLLKVKAGSDEDRQDFLQRLVKAASSMDDDVFYQLSTPAQEWINDGTKAIKDGKDVADFEAGKKTQRVSAKARDEEAGEKKPVKKEKKGMSSVMIIRHYLVDNPDATNDEILKHLQRGGHKELSPVAIGTVRSDFRGVVRVLQEKGVFKRDVTLGKQ